MKRDFLILLALLVCTLGATAWSDCPEDAHDFGNCDSMYIEPWSPDTLVAGSGPFFVRVPIYVTHDKANPTDSLAAFVITLCYWHSNKAKYCSVGTYWNTVLWGTSTIKRSVFRHMPSYDTVTVHNWMMDLYELEEGAEWNTTLLSLSSDSSKVYDGVDSVPAPAHFWLTLIPSSGEDQRFGPGNHVLLATMTFKLQDTMQIIIDSCLYPPSNRLAYSNSDGQAFIPRMGTPHADSSYKMAFRVRTPADVKEIEGSNDIKPSSFSLSQNYPNPFNPTTNFQFTLPKSSHVNIEIFNIVGQKVAILVDGDMKPGVYTADWNGRDESGKTVSSGIYFYRMKADDFSDMKKMVLVK